MIIATSHYIVTLHLRCRPPPQCHNRRQQKGKNNREREKKKGWRNEVIIISLNGNYSTHCSHVSGEENHSSQVGRGTLEHLHGRIIVFRWDVCCHFPSAATRLQLILFSGTFWEPERERRLGANGGFKGREGKGWDRKGRDGKGREESGSKEMGRERKVRKGEEMEGKEAKVQRRNRKAAQRKG